MVGSIYVLNVSIWIQGQLVCTGKNFGNLIIDIVVDYPDKLEPKIQKELGQRLGTFFLFGHKKSVAKLIDRLEDSLRIMLLGFWNGDDKFVFYSNLYFFTLKI